tara:strand:+ start:253 stop:486 length:234 start_codon:yes stop_codon:yes gene_type:complete
MAFICGYCGQKKDYSAYIEGKEKPCCASCIRHWEKCNNKHLHHRKIKDDPNNPYSKNRTFKEWLDERNLKQQGVNND